MQLPNRDTAVLAMTLDGDPAALAPIRMVAREAISQAYEVDITAVHVGPDFAPEEILQKKVVLTLRWADKERTFAGYVQEYAPVVGGFREYAACRIKVVPKLWGLSIATDCRIFQEKTAEDILSLVFALAGVESSFKITGAKPTLPYRTQYNESCLDFARRIMEESGWFFFFSHGDSGEEVVVADSNTAFDSLGAIEKDSGLIGSMLPVHGIATAKETTSDYDPVSPTTDLSAEMETKLAQTGLLSIKSFAWPARATQADAATERVKARMEAAEAMSALLQGEGRWPEMVPGCLFEVPDGTRGLPSGTFGIRSVRHEAVDETWLTGTGAASYANTFEAFPEAQPWREPMDTPRPRMDGVHAAVVIGEDDPGGVFTDDLGRVKIRFFWDHRQEATTGDGIWARVVQPWAGKGWGAQFIPRIGTEVACAFMNGDPDYPVVLGGLYNGQDTPIFLKADKDKSGFRSRSFETAAGGGEEFSEFTFNDKKGHEEVFLHAQKDYKVNVENDLKLKVDNCRIVEITKDDTVGIKGKQDYTVKGNQTLVIEEGHRKIDVKKGDQITTLGKGDYKVTTDLGDMKFKAAAGEVMIEAMKSITLKVGANTVIIDMKGVKINGMMLKFKAEMIAQIDSGLMTKMKAGIMTKVESGVVTMVKGGVATLAEGGTATVVKGGAATLVKGGVVMIN
ncbi:type VI secretion system Vgr family protein [Falsiroseomonas sp. HW251]|uniref:type VI secretion system Vgr family protein n=1 Tax=Falsiroseomonas sp. HW251 TaxID=3390998 RepID=UPI003D317351